MCQVIYLVKRICTFSEHKILNHDCVQYDFGLGLPSTVQPTWNLCIPTFSSYIHFQEPNVKFSNLHTAIFRRVCKIAKNDYYNSFVTSLCPSAWNNSAPTERILMKFDIWIFSRKSVKKIQVSFKPDKNNRYFTWRRFDTFDNISLNSSYNEKCFRQKL